jgi:hypothetical protein
MESTIIMKAVRRRTKLRATTTPGQRILQGRVGRLGVFAG